MLKKPQIHISEVAVHGQGDIGGQYRCLTNTEPHFALEARR